MGFAIAECLAENGAQVILVAGPVHLQIQHPNIKRFNITTAEEMYHICIAEFPSCTAAILCAAVADYKPTTQSLQKIKKTDSEELVLRLEKNKDILAELGDMKTDGQILGGFSLETNDEEKYAIEKMRRKNCDFIVLNSLKTEGAGFGKDTNVITIFSSKGDAIKYSLKPKKEVAQDIVDFVLENYF